MRLPASRFAAYAGTVDLPVTARAVSRPQPAAAGASTLEQRHPAVVQALTLLWGRPEMNQYFEKVASGLDPRLTLEPEAMSELMLLAAVHQHVCPYRPAKKIEEIYGAGHWADTWKPARSRF